MWAMRIIFCPRHSEVREVVAMVVCFEGRAFGRYDLEKSGDDLFDHSSVHIREAEVASGIAVGELFVIDS